jgi:4'-phosphopantetheinyl transferase
VYRYAALYGRLRPYRRRLAIPLAFGVAHLWTVDLSRGDWREQSLAVLSAEERERALRFRHGTDMRRYAVGRAALRTILGGYLSIPAHEIALVYGPHGKPSLAGGGPRFSFSHSDDLAVAAFAGEAELGVDVERLDREAEIDNVVSRFASKREREAFAALPAEERRPAFFRWWTRKEALAKAAGLGLSAPFESFDVSIAAGDARLLSTRLAELGGAWMLNEFEPAPGFIGALASYGQLTKMESFAF